MDGQRAARGLTWQRVAREINNTFEGVKTARPVAASTLTGMPSRTSVEGNVVLLVLRWLDRTPESFIPNHPAPTAPGTALPRLPPDRILRWDLQALFATTDAQRRQHGLTWKQVADEIEGFTPGMLTGLAKARHTGFPQVMRLVTWLGQPAVSFTAERSR